MKKKQGSCGRVFNIVFVMVYLGFYCHDFGDLKDKKKQDSCGRVFNMVFVMVYLGFYCHDFGAV